MEPLVNMEASSQHLTMDLPAEKPSYLGNPTLSMIDDAKSNDSNGSVDDSCGPSDSKENKESLGVKVKRKGRRGRSSGSLTMKGDKITSFTTERGVTYSPNDHVYIENNKPGQPYFICAIQDFSVIKRDTLVVKVKWYYRVSEVPDNVYQHLIQDRYHQDVEGDHPLVNPAVKSRELFCSEATDTYPVTALRGKCKVVHCNSLEAARCYQPAADNFYCILGYNPETKRLATTQGQIRVGSMYQARMPECKPHVPPKEMPERCEDREVFHWQPKSVLDGDLMMYLRAARSVAAFAGMCDGGSTEDGCQAASMDSTTMNAMHMLHRFDYDTGKALQALVKAPALRTIDKKWNEDDTKHFVKGLRVYGKNFFKIRKELLPHRETGELVEYYYFWKKSPAAAANRPHRRHRKHGVKRATTRSQRPASSEFLDLSSASDSDNDSEDSDSLSGFRCQNCLVTVSKDWSNAGKPSPRLCSKCRIFFKKYGVDRPLENTGDSPYFQPVKDGDINGTHNMLTRQNRSSTDSKDKKKGSNSVSSPDNLDSPLSDSKKSLVPSSPSAVSTCSNSSTDREKKRRSSVSPGQDKKRLHPASDSEDKFSKRKRSGPSESESVSDSSISGAEETPNDADIETNQDELTSSSPPTTPSPVESDYKQDKSTPVPIPVESAIGLDKLSELPRPEPQHPSPNRQPLESSPLLSPNPPQLPSVSQLPSQGFVALPPLPAFAFRPQCPLSDSIYPRPPFSSQSEQKLSADDKSSTPSATAFQPPKPHTVASEDKSDSSVISSPQVKEEVISPPQSPMNHIFIKQEPSDSVSFMSKPSQNGTSGKSANINTDAFAQKEPFELLTPKLEPGLPKSESGLHRPDVGLHRSDVGVHRLDSALHRIESGLHRPESGMHRPESGLHRPDTGLHRPDQNSHRQEQVLNRQEQSLHRPESGMQRDAGLPRPDSGLRRTDPGLHRQDPSLHRSEQGLHRVEGLYRPEPGVLRPEPGVHRSELGVHRPEQGVLRPEPGVLRPEPGVLRPEPGLHRPEPGVHRPEQGLQSSISNSNISANINSSSSDFTHLSSNQIQIEPTALTSQAEVKGQSEAQGVDSEGQEGERSEVEIMDDSDSERGTLTPGPVPTPCNKEILRSKSAIFIKLLNRGEHNSCSRCDLMFKPLPDSKLARRREDREKKVMTPVTPMKEEAKRKTESPPPNSTADAQVVSNIPPSHHTHQDRVTPRSSYHDTPALRQLSEYAKPHSMGQDPRAMAGYLGFSPFMDPIRMAAMYPPNSRERLELELERDKRERDQRERELREHELRSIEMREKLKAELEMKPPGLDRLIPPGANQLDPHWLEIQRRYGPQMLPGGSGSSHIPGIYPPTSLASDLMARERDRLERLGIPPGHPMLADSSYTAAIMERLSAERMSVERMSAERLSAERIQAERMAMQQDPMIRLQMSGMSGAAAAAAAAAAHAHTHTHAHSHTHLHLHQPDMPGGPLGPAGPVPTSSGLHHPLLPPHLLHSLPPGADPMSGVNGANNQTPPGSMPSLPVGLPPPHMLASREQELIQNDLYRRAYTDPALAQQLQAHHEALQRMVMERERFGSGHLPPPH